MSQAARETVAQQHHYVLGYRCVASTQKFVDVGPTSSFLTAEGPLVRRAFLGRSPELPVKAQ